MSAIKFGTIEDLRAEKPSTSKFFKVSAKDILRTFVSQKGTKCSQLIGVEGICIGEPTSCIELSADGFMRFITL